MFHMLTTFDTGFSVDSVEWCPIESQKELFVCGTYQLSEGSSPTETGTGGNSQRLGRIYLIRVLNNGTIKVLQRIDVPAVLDMKWAHVQYENKTLLGVVNAAGYLQIYRLNGESLELFTEIKVRDEVLALSLDWCSGRWIFAKEEYLKIAVSDSKGGISLYQIGSDNLEALYSRSAHEFEAWIVAFDYWNTNVLYTGGDDCKFRCFDTRIDMQPVTTNKIHGAGVTSLHSNSRRENILASGSYDEILRLWDTRSLKHPVSEINLGGGIWRLKWDPFEHRYLLAACMYNGFKIIDCDNFNAPFIEDEYNEDQRIAYGCDWAYFDDNHSLQFFQKDLLNLNCKKTMLVATCSFYDHVLKLSTQ